METQQALRSGYQSRPAVCASAGAALVMLISVSLPLGLSVWCAATPAVVESY